MQGYRAKKSRKYLSSRSRLILTLGSKGLGLWGREKGRAVFSSKLVAVGKWLRKTVLNTVMMESKYSFFRSRVEMHVCYDRHHEVSSLIKVRPLSVKYMELSNNLVNHEVLIKQHLCPILDISVNAFQTKMGFSKIRNSVEKGQFYTTEKVFYARK